MKPNRQLSVLSTKLVRAGVLCVPLLALFFMAIGKAKAQVSILEGDTAYICQVGRTSQELSVTEQLGSSYKWYNLDKPIWYQVGSSFGNSNTSYPSIGFKGNTPYVAMKDTINNAKIVVVKYDGMNWEQVGGPIQWGFDQKISFKGDTAYVAFADITEGGKNSVYKFDGTNWVKEGNSIGGLDVNANFNYASRSLCFNAGIPYVSFVEADSSSKAVMYKFDGTAWVSVGSAFGPTNSSVTSMSFNLDTAYVVLTNKNNFKTEVYKFNGTTWDQVGLGVGTAFNNGDYKPSINFNGSTPYIAFTDASSFNENVVYTYNGTSWVKVGNSLGTYGVPKIEFNNGIAHVLVKNLFPSIGYSLYTFDGANWLKLDSSFGGQYCVEHNLMFNGGAPYVIFKEGSPNVLSVYKFGPSIVSDLHSFSANTIGTYMVEEKDQNGVLSYDTIKVLNAPLITAGASATAVGCNDGNINLTVNGGTSPFSYQWNNGATTQNLTSVGLGYYSVIVTDNMDCVAKASIVAKAAALVAASLINQNDTALICTTNPANLNVTAQLGASYKWYKPDSLNWQQVGNAIGSYSMRTPCLTIKEGTSYVAYGDADNGYRSVVRFYDGRDWQQLGGAFGNNYQYGHKMVFHDGAPYVACIDGSNSEAVLYKFDGSDWVQIGSRFGRSNDKVGGLIFEGNTPYVTFRDLDNNNKMALYKFDGANWAKVGNSFGGNDSYEPSLKFNASIPYVAFSDGANNRKISVYKFDGTNWVQVGSSFGGDWSGYQSLAFDNVGVPYVAFGDGDINNYQAAVYRFNGSSWVMVGNHFGGNNSYFQHLVFDANEPYVAFSDGSSANKSSVYKYNGSSWVKIGSSFGNDNSSFQSLSFDNSIPYIAFLNGSSRPIAVHKFDDANISNLPAISIGTQGVYVAIETDANGCKSSDTVRVVQVNILPPIASVTLATTSCSNATSGAVNIMVTGGTAPYTYLWSTNETTQNISNLSMGDYSVIVFDSIGCSASTSASVLETPVAQANLIAQGDSAFACGNGVAHLSVSSIPGYAYQWYELDSLSLQPHGTSFGGTGSYSQSLKMNNGVPYVAFADNDNSYLTSVYKHNGTAWVKVGNSFGSYGSYGQSLYFINNIPYVTSGNNNEITVYSFNGTNWVQVGTSITNVFQSSLSSKGVTPYIAVKDGNNNGSTSVLRFDGTNWVQVGSTFGGENSNGQTLVISDTTMYVSFNDGEDNNTLSLYLFDGTNWVKLGNSLGGPYSGNASVAVHNGVPYIAFDDSYSNEDDNHKVAVYKYDGTNWVQLGGQFGGGGVYEKSISFNDSIPYVAFSDDYGQHNKIVLYQFNGSNWIRFGKPVGGEDSYSPSLSFDNGIAYLAFSDGNLMNQSVVYKFSPTQISNALAITTSREGLYVVKTTEPDGCRVSDTVAVVHKNIPALAAATASTTTCSNTSTGSISLSLTNGTAPYTYNWSNGQTSQNATLLAIGRYSVIAIDSNGCSVSAKDNVTETPATAVNIITQGGVLTQCGADTTLLSVGQQPGYSYKWFKADLIVWQQIGNSFGGEESSVQRLCFDGITPYVAFRDADENGSISVYTLSGGNWVQLGNTFGDGNETGWSDNLTLSMHINEGVPYVAFSDDDDYQISVYKFDGTDWVQVGDKFGDESYYQSLSFDGNTPYVAFEDDNNNRRSVVYYFNGAEWEQLGDAFGEYDCKYQSLEIHNGVPYVAFSDGDSEDETFVFRYNGNDWEQLGNSFGGEDASYQNLRFNGSTPYVALSNSTRQTTVYQYNGTNWVAVGSPFGGSAYYQSLTFNDGVPYVAFSDESQNYESKVYQYNGTAWVQVGGAFGGESIYQSIAFSNGIPYVAVASEDNDYKTTVYKFEAAEIDNTNEVIVQTAGRYVVESVNPDGCRGNDTVVVVNYVATGNNTMGEDQIICNGSTPTAFLANTPGLGDTVTYNFAWLTSTLNADSGFAPASGVNNTVTYTPVPLTDTTWYKRIVYSSLCGVDTSSALTIMVTLDSAGTWTGAQNWAWANTANWSCPSIPERHSRVTIPGSANYMPQIIDAREVLDLTIQGGAYLSLGGSASALSIYGTITNNGSLSAYNGKLIFTGTTPQTIPNGNYGKIEINNPAGLTINGTVSLYDSLILTNGIVQLGASDLNLMYNSLASKGSPTSYIATNGTGKFIAYEVGADYGKSDTVYIPIGNSTYNPISIIDNDNTSHYAFSVIDSITATYNGYEPTGSMYTNGAVNRTWAISPSNGAANTASITFGWSATNELPLFNRNNSFVTVYNYNDSEWVTSPGTAASGSGMYSQTITGVAGNNVFGIGSGNGVGLPVNLLNLAATKEQNNVNLTWTTASEVNNAYFVLQRSVDGKIFETIATVQGNGTTHVLNNYAYLDNKVSNLKRPTANVFYRLIQTDFDGAQTTSKTVVVNMDESKAGSQQLTAAISPNPFTDITNVTVTTSKAERATLKVTDTQGRLVFEKQVELQAGENRIIMSELGSANTGIYFVSILTTTESLVQRIAKAK